MMMNQDNPLSFYYSISIALIAIPSIIWVASSLTYLGYVITIATLALWTTLLLSCSCASVKRRLTRKQPVSSSPSSLNPSNIMLKKPTITESLTNTYHPYLSQSLLNEIKSTSDFIVTRFITSAPWYVQDIGIEKNDDGNDFATYDASFLISHTLSKVLKIVSFDLILDFDKFVSLISSVSKSIENHIEILLLSSSSSPSKSYDDTMSVVEVINVAALKSSKLHHACNGTVSDERNYIRSVVKKLLNFLLNDHHTHQISLRTVISLLTEILLEKVVFPASRLLSPITINGLLSRLYRHLEVLKSSGEYNAGRVPSGFNPNDLGWKYFGGMISPEEARGFLNSSDGKQQFLLRKKRREEEASYAVVYTNESDGGVKELECKFKGEDEFIRNDTRESFTTLSALIESIRKSEYSSEEEFSGVSFFGEKNPATVLPTKAETTTAASSSSGESTMELLQKQLSSVYEKEISSNTTLTATRGHVKKSSTIVSNCGFLSPQAKDVSSRLLTFEDTSGYFSDDGQDDDKKANKKDIDSIATLESELDEINAVRRHVILRQLEFACDQLSEKLKISSDIKTRASIETRALCQSIHDVLEFGYYHKKEFNLFKVLQTCESLDASSHQDLVDSDTKDDPSRSFIIKSLCHNVLSLRISYILSCRPFEISASSNIVYTSNAIMNHQGAVERVTDALDALTPFNVTVGVNDTSSHHNTTSLFAKLETLKDSAFKTLEDTFTSPESKKRKEKLQLLHLPKSRERRKASGNSNTASDKLHVISDEFLQARLKIKEKLSEMKILLSDGHHHYKAGILSGQKHNDDPDNKTTTSAGDSSSSTAVIRYEICVECLSCFSQWKVYKRYSEFLTLYNSIVTHCPTDEFTSYKFPPKARSNLDPKLISFRKKRLHELLQLLLTSRFTKSCYEVVLFLELDLHRCSGNRRNNNVSAANKSSSPSSDSKKKKEEAVIPQRKMTTASLSPEHVGTLCNSVFSLLYQIMLVDGGGGTDHHHAVGAVRRKVLHWTQKLVVASTQTSLLLSTIESSVLNVEKIQEEIQMQMNLSVTRIKNRKVHSKIASPKSTRKFFFNQARELQISNYQDAKLLFNESIRGHSVMKPLIGLFGEDHVVRGLNLLHLLLQCQDVLRSLVYTLVDIVLEHLCE